MPARKEKLYAYIEAGEAEKVERLAGIRRRSISDTVTYLVLRGLERESETELAQLIKVVDAHGDQIELLQALIESLESREAERFRLFLGHLQQHQAITTELLHLLRLMFMDERPSAYAKLIETARLRVTEDAKVFRASLASGGGARRKMGSQQEAG